MESLSTGRGTGRGSRNPWATPPAPEMPRHPAVSEDAMTAGVRETFFYVHIRGRMRFHFFDLHRNGSVRLYGGTYQNGPVSSSDFHGWWVTHDNWMGDETYVAAMTLVYHYMGNAADHMHHVLAKSVRFFPDLWVCFENNRFLAVLWRIPPPRPRIPPTTIGVPLAMHEL